MGIAKGEAVPDSGTPNRKLPMNPELNPTASASTPVVAQPTSTPVVVSTTPTAPAAPAPAPVAATPPAARPAKKQRANKRALAL